MPRDNQDESAATIRMRADCRGSWYVPILIVAGKAQSRLTARYRKLSARGKLTTVVCTAVARELAAFMWSIGRTVQPG